jgi:hypothetical protein
MVVYLRTPPHVEAAAMRGILAFDGVAAAALCTVPALHIVGAPPKRRVGALHGIIRHRKGRCRVP